jgi:hypothetical protein
MNPPPSTPLSFGLVDDLALANSTGKKRVYCMPERAAASDLGPLIELAWHGKAVWQVESKRLSGFEELIGSLKSSVPVWVSNDKRVGFLRVRRGIDDTLNSRWVSYCLSVQHAFQSVGTHKHTAQQMIGAIQELEENIHLHSDAPRTGLVAHWCHEKAFEFVIADRGIGILASLTKRADFAKMSDHGIALRTALQDGNSSLGPEREGVGFHDLFVGLANHSAKLRFRSGDHALVIDGTSPKLAEAQLIQLARLKGFVVSVRCSLS